MNRGADILVCGLRELSSSSPQPGDWKIALTRRLGSLRYNARSTRTASMHQVHPAALRLQRMFPVGQGRAGEFG